MAIDGVGWDWSYMANDEEDHALVADEVAPTKFAVMANTSAESKIYHYKLALAQLESRLVEYKEREVKYCEKIITLEFHNESNNECIKILKKKLETLKEEKEGVDGKLAGLLKASKDLDNLIEIQRPPPNVESTSGDDQNRNPSISETVASPIAPKPFIKFVNPKDSQSNSKTGKTESPKKPPVKYAEQYRKPIKKPNGSSQNNINDKGYWDSGCSRHMTGNISYLSDFEPFDGGYVSFGQGGCKITGKGTIKTGTIFTNLSGTKDAASQEVKKDVSFLRYIAFPNWTYDALLEFSSSKPQDHCSTEVHEGSGNPNPTASTSNPPAAQMEALTVETHILTVSSPVPTAYSINSQEPSSDARLISKRVANQVETPSLDNILSLTNRFEDILGVSSNSEKSNGVEADISNMETAITASPTPTLRIHKDHPKSQIIEKSNGVEADISNMETAITASPTPTLRIHKDHPKIEPKKIFDALQDPSWVEAMQEELLQFKIQNVWTLVDFPKWVRPIGTKWVLKNKKDERGIVIRNKARLVAQGHTQEEGIDYDEVFAPFARIEAIRLFLAYASFMGFTVYQMDVKSAFLYGTIDEEVYVMQPPGFQDPKSPAKVYKVEKAMGTINQTLFIRRQRGDFILVQVYKEDGIFLLQDKYVGDTLKKFEYSDVRSSNTPMDKENPWGKDETRKDVDLHLYRSMIGSLMYLTASRPDIMFAKEDGIFLLQDKYVGDILKKFEYSDVRSSNTPMDKENPWGKDETRKDVDLHLYRSMIGSLMYLTAS
nr:hypothetical protein [Tanacetum cinerariifolium]